MNAHSGLPQVTLDDKYTVTDGTVYITGVQALVRLPMLRRQLDRELGLNTAGFISGYRGSPLGTYDSQLWKAKGLLDQHHVVFKPGINEDLGATAVWGSQQVGLYPGATYDGVFGIWYGKGPGVDRTGDAFKHANFAGTAPNGGVLAFAGDDHACKSSTMPNQSEFAFMDAEMPVLNPTGVEELLAFGMKGFGLSRYAGLWVGMKTIADTMDSTAVIDVDLAAYRTVIPEGVALPPDGLNIRLVDTPAAAEERHRRFRLPAAQAFARANGFDRVVLDSPRARFGIVATGKAYLHVRQALQDLGIGDEMARDWGIRLYKVGLAWPLDPVGAAAFAGGLEEVLVVEERRDVLEHQLKAALYHLPEGRRPRVSGKTDPDGRPLVRDTLDLDTGRVVQAILARLPAEWRTPKMASVQAVLSDPARTPEGVQPLHVRGPFFCSGCPHNTSTNLPEGSRATAGIGCHFLVQWMDRRAEACTHMGGEGVPWMGQAPFTSERHIFANLGDGTYFHSGSLAVRQSIAAGVNITYKVLYNDAVAMTGGQRVDGTLTVPMIVAQMAAEGVTRIAVVSDDPERHRGDPAIPSWVSFDHRDRLDAVQKELREVQGVSVLVYDQTCATEKRRRRKRGLMETPDRRLVINEAVCEGCGDCSVKSNCLSVEPIETEFGRKRRIDQSSCNQDFSCANGFCPSFVSVVGGTPRKGAGSAKPRLDLPDPALPSLEAEPWNVMLTGIGGQGVAALAAIIGMATHLEGKRLVVVDQLGMAQKGGGVYSHIRIARADQEIFSPRIGPGQTDLLIASDIVVGHGRTALPSLGRERTHALVNADLAPTSEFVRNNEVHYDVEGMIRSLRANSRALDRIPAQALVVSLLGDAIYLNVFLLGAAYQKGLVPLSAAALERAIELNGVSADKNKLAFQWGRHYAADPASIPVPGAPEPVATTLAEIVARRRADLAAYQNEAYARSFEALVERARLAEAGLGRGEALAIAIAKSLHKLMAYKDEYEVARLYTDGRFLERVGAGFDGPVTLRFHMAPPLLSRRDPDTGRPVKRTFGPWLMPALRVLARMKGLRGTALDPFGYTEERRTERALIGAYRATVERLLAGLTADNHALAVEIAALPLTIRGFGHVKEANLAKARKREEELLARFAPAREEASVPAATPALLAEVG